jgi:protein tyrosine phosphatase
MKLEKLQKIIPDQVLYNAIVGDLSPGTKIKHDEIVRRTKIAGLIDKLLETLKTSLASGIQKGSCKKLIKKLQHSDAPISLPSVPAPVSLPETPEQFSLFPEEVVSISSLASKALEYKARHCEKSLALIDAIKARVAADPEIRALTQIDAKRPEFLAIASQHNSPFDFNRLGRELPGVFLDASEVQTSVQTYLLSGLPRTLKTAQDYWDQIIVKGSRVVVSLHETGEAKSRCHDFWKEDRIKEMTFRDGWTLRVTEPPVEDKGQGSGPKIIETTYEASREGEKRTITHLHYDGWVDRSAIPDEDLFSTLVRRIKGLSSDREAPIAINCHGGIGRTGTLAVCYDLFKESEQQLATGTTPDKVFVNVPERLYALRKQRASLIGQPTQFSQIPSVLSKLFPIPATPQVPSTPGDAPQP